MRIEEVWKQYRYPGLYASNVVVVGVGNKTKQQPKPPVFAGHKVCVITTDKQTNKQKLNRILTKSFPVGVSREI